MSVYRRSFAYFRPYLSETTWAVLLAIGSIGLNLLKPWPFKWIIDGVLPAPGEKKVDLGDSWLHWIQTWSAPQQILALAALLVLIHLAWGVVNMVANYLFVKVGLKTLLDVRTDLYATLHALPLKYHDARRSGDSSFRVAYDSQAIQTIYNRGFSNILVSVLTLVGALIIMWQLDPFLATLSILILPPAVWAIYFFADRVRRESTDIQEQESSLLTLAQEGLSSIKLVHAFGGEEQEVRQFRKQADRSLVSNMRLAMTNVSSAMVIGTLMAGGTAVMLYFGAMQVLEGELPLGSLWLFTAYVAMLYQPIEALTYTFWAMESAAAGAQRCFEVLDRENDLPEKAGAPELHVTKGGVRFEGVHFGYHEHSEILKGIDLEVIGGTSLALVGGTGAGKSTLLSLVPRFYDPTLGRVLVDEQDICEVAKKSLRTSISIVLQDTLLFSTTIRENIAYGRPEATEEEIMEAARRAEAHTFISAMKDGYSSQVGERGGHLSVGQRQRIGIARAFLKNAPILILDEPTSALDATTEAAIMATLESLMQGRTTLLITHRIPTIHRMDRIAVLDAGKVVEIGTGPDLVAMGGIYAGLHHAAHHGKKNTL